MADCQYDKLLRELETLEQLHPEFQDSDSPTLRVGGKALDKFEQVKHNVPLQSLQDVFDFAELSTFLKKTAQKVKPNYVVEPKIDGLSVSLEYIGGKFVRGATRGNGLIGEDV